MRKIILASRSRARRDLLRQIGLKFETTASYAKESRTLRGKKSALVIKNALKKEKDVTIRYDSGVIIAADTLVFVGNRIIGKPKDRDDAFRTLKFLSRNPQWIYTGIAVIDIDKGMTYTGYEKTKVRMNPLSDEHIHNYLKWASPFDKAGSFDIQGLGSIFIDRIEGCYYNVVGLPITKLAKILRRCGIDAF